MQSGFPVFFSMPAQEYGARSEFSVDSMKSLPRVEIVYSHADLGRDVFDYFV
jgi:hypothetical protein